MGCELLRKEAAAKWGVSEGAYVPLCGRVEGVIRKGRSYLILKMQLPIDNRSYREYIYQKV